MNQKTIDEYLQWSRDAFGDEYWITVLSKLRTEEVWEFRRAVVLESKEAQKEEMADCFFLLIKASHLVGISIQDIEEAMDKKLEILKQRKYENGRKV